ncbi:MAG TPA: MBL fold metallo-hydrolase, partial [Thermoanaerobaculia bacterium]|nr:MBL fold metallo-hydrolase [Thermoanaerobaculia bacterium]
MRLIVFPSDHGDCLLLESADQRMLIDGGPGSSFKRHVLPYLSETADRPLDCVYLSHIDHDHIGGLLVLLDALFEWAVYQYRSDKGKNPKEPKMPRPPEVLKVWHNGFDDMLPGQSIAIAGALENTAAILSALDGKLDATTKEVVRFHRDLATHAGHAMELQYRIGGNQLGIALNPEANGNLLLRDGVNAPDIPFGDATFTLLGPTQADIDGLRVEWQHWLDDIKNKEKLLAIEEARKKDADALTNAAAAFIRPLELQGRDLAATL